MMIKRGHRIPADRIKDIRAFGTGVQLVVEEVASPPALASEMKNIRSFGANRIAAPGKAKKGPQR